MHTKQIGYIGETLAKLKFAEMDYQVFSPECENTEYDFIVVKGNVIVPIQVKTTENIKDGVAIFDFRKTYSNATGNHAESYINSPLFIIVCLENQFVGILSSEKSSIKIRFEKPLNGQTKNINFSEDFLLTQKRLEQFLC